MKVMTPVLKVSLLIICPLLVWGAVSPDDLALATSSIQRFLQQSLGWFYLLSVSGLLLCAVYLIFSR